AINPDRTMSDICGAYAGLGVDEARATMTDALEAQGALRLREPYRHSVPHSQRSGIRIEPLISLQWFADMRSLAEPVSEWVRDGTVRFVPDGMKSIFHGWMDDLKPWCLSRQLWWGHQLPVWYHVDAETRVHVSTDGPPADEADQWRRDEDVLDTWFSSGMWDHATLGWPDDTPELRYFHPTAVLCTGRDIINLWVARMMMFSSDHLGEVPFHDVYLHSTVQAADGRRMSKSLGTGVDPLDLIASYGADAVRYGLLDMSSTQDVRFNEGRIKEGNQLANKLWNALRLLQVFGGADIDPETVDAFDPATSAVRLEDRWILARLDRVQREVTRALDAYEFHNVTKALYNFCWNELCDWYLESIKDRLRSEAPVIKREAVTQLAWVLHETISLIHPVMPHLSEELSAQLWGEPGPEHCLVAASDWSSHTFEAGVSGAIADAEEQFTRTQTLVTRLRNVRQAADIKPRTTVHARLELDDPSAGTWSDLESLLLVLANVEVGGGEPGVSGIALPIEGGSLVLYGLDAQVLKPKLEAELTTARGEVKRAEGKLANDKFTARAPAELVQEERDKIDRFTREGVQLETVIAQL
ncbi:MAG: class I tRNA ligase family protein, partial [Thermoleophilia bacterium]|nr:class I tRNA ligase family protein [Thermoleophilia bacterium]